MTRAPVVMPHEPDVCFTFAPSGVPGSSPVRLPRHQSAPFVGLPAHPLYLPIEYDTAYPTLYRSRALWWEGVVYATRWDEGRALHAVRLAEIGILFVAVLRNLGAYGFRPSGALDSLALCCRAMQQEHTR